MNIRDINVIKRFLGDDFCRAVTENNPSRNLTDLYFRIAYIIKKFIEKSEEKILFIKFPIEELSVRTEARQDEAWETQCNIIALSLRSCLQKPNLKSSTKSLLQSDKKYLLVMPEESDERFYFVKKSQDTNSLKFYWESKFVNGHNRNEPRLTTQAKEEVLREAKQIFEISQFPRLDKSGCVSENQYKHYEDEVKLLNLIQGDYSQKSPYEKGMVVRCPETQNSMCAGKLIKPIVSLYNKNDRLSESDIAIVVGDKAYARIQTLRNRIIRGELKKLIIWGSVVPDDLNNQEFETVVLSHRELFDYCVSNDNISYSPPEFIEIEFPWLKETLAKLKNIIDSFLNESSDNLESYQKDAIKHVYNYSKKSLANIEFNKNELEFFKSRFPSWLDREEFSFLQEEEVEKLMDWCEGLTYESDSNPKMKYCTNNQVFKIINESFDSRKVPSNLGYDKLIVIDAPIGYDQNPENLINRVARFYTFQKIHCLYFKGIETDKLQKAKRVFEGDPVFCDSQADNQNDNQATAYFDLEDYIINPESDLNGWRVFIDREYSYKTIDFTDGSSETLTGYIIISDEDMPRLINISQIDFEDRSGEKITFYSQSDDANSIYDEITKKYFVLNDGRTINDYVTLWQNALNELINQNSQELFTSICEELKIKPQTLRNHLNGDVRFLRGRAMEKILDILIKFHKISGEDKENILRARKFHNIEYKQFGIRLKEALLDKYIKNDADSNSFLNEIKEKTGYDFNTLKNTFIKTKTIK